VTEKEQLELEKARVELEKAKADFEKSQADAAQAKLAALIPDFGAVERGALTLPKDGAPEAGSGVVGRALKAAAQQVKDDMVGRFQDGWKVLITSDANLAASDAAYWNARTALERLAELAREALDATSTQPEGGETRPEAFPIIPVLGALAGAVPGLVSLLRTDRTVTSGAVTIDDLAAVAAVAGVVKGENPQRTVYHDTFRALPRGELAGQVDALLELRRQLGDRRRSLEQLKVPEGEAAERLKAAVAEVKGLMDGIDAFLTAGTAVAKDAAASPLAAAALREGLHDGTFTHALLVKAQPASALQVVSDRAFGNDPVEVLAVASIAWVLTEVATGQLLDAGVSSGSARVHGTIGKDFKLE